MSRRTAATLLLILLLAASPLPAQRRRGPAPSIGTQPVTPAFSSLTVYLVLQNEQQAGGMQLRVQLLNNGGVPVGDTFSDSSGQARFAQLPAGSYRLRVTGIDIEEITTPNFEVMPREAMHMERVYVRLKSDAARRPTSKQGTISAVSLQVPEKAERELERGNKAAHKKDLEGAKTHYRKAIEIFPQYALAYNNVGVICMQQQDYACARNAFEKAVEADPGLPSGYVHLAHLRVMEKDAPAAQSLVEKALTINPLDPEALSIMAQALLMNSSYDDCVRYARKVHTVPHKDFPVAHLIAGRALELQNKPREAAVEYETFLKEAPEHRHAATAREGLARVQSAQAAAVPRQP